MNDTPSAILVLDDEELLRETLAIFLENNGFTVFQAISAENALAELSNRACQAVVVDIRLPGMSGLQFIEKAHVLWPQLKFLIYTGSPGVFLSSDKFWPPASHPKISSPNRPLIFCCLPRPCTACWVPHEVDHARDAPRHHPDHGRCRDPA